MGLTGIIDLGHLSAMGVQMWQSTMQNGYLNGHPWELR